MKSLTVLLALLLVGCAQPVLEIADPRDHHRTAVKTVLESDISNNRNLARNEMWPAVNRVLPRVRNAALRVCLELKLANERCQLLPRLRVQVLTDKPDINAFADGNDEVGLYGGLVSKMGSDAEIAAVLAHEFAHVMFGHVEKKTNNTLVGMSVAAGLVGVFAYSTDTNPQHYQDSWMQAGAMIGSRAYSPEMEIEADRAAIYILHEAGFAPQAMQAAIVRMNQIKRQTRRFGLSRTIGFLDTHPSNDRRISHILSAIDDAQAGVALKVARQ